MSWQERAACARRGIDRNVRASITTIDPPLAAQLLCAGCPVAGQCFRWGDAQGWYEGLAGGALFTEKQVQPTEWTPRHVLRLLPSAKHRAADADGPARGEGGKFRGPSVEDIEDLARQGLTAPAIAERLGGIKADSLYTKLRRWGRDDLWDLISKAGATGIAQEKRERAAS